MITRSSLASENNGIPQTGLTLVNMINPFSPSAGRVFIKNRKNNVIINSIIGMEGKVRTLCQLFIIFADDAERYSKMFEEFCKS